ncbi:DUF6509 family protein [Peribacillus deserti]|uniref:Pullulanase n=1 Tax=Peribacillus deserti TaxID=673318 RepID=A0A2N5M0W8_9BACI|nr:DUF6509 family protein [Peribacillus deserti]PLT28002.1 pullulanase [Peribacillus deserti]
MLTIINHEAEEIKDPFGILSGRRYEFYLQAEVPEDDELYRENGVYIRVVFSVDEGRSSLIKYDLYEYVTDAFLDFELEEEEEELIAEYCRNNLPGE